MKISAMLTKLLSKKYIFLIYLFFNIQLISAFSVELTDLDRFITKQCLSLKFFEKSVFEDEVENYAGILIRKGKTLCILYPENDFGVLKTPREVRVKSGKDIETYDLEEFPNPLLKMLFFIDKWKEFFEVKQISEDIYKLIPKDENLKETVSHILVKMKGETPEVIKIVADSTNYVVFEILKTSEGCKIDNRCNF
jgi:hypothetical protein